MVTSTSLHIIDCCLVAISHHLSQCWHRPMASYCWKGTVVHIYENYCKSFRLRWGLRCCLPEFHFSLLSDIIEKLLAWDPFHKQFLHHNSYSTEFPFSCISTVGDYIATKFGTWYGSTAVVPCAKFCTDYFIRIWINTKWNLHHIWIVMGKFLVILLAWLIICKPALGWHLTDFEVDGIAYIDGLMQDCSNSSASAVELLQSWTKSSICALASCPSLVQIMVCRLISFKLLSEPLLEC